MNLFDWLPFGRVAHISAAALNEHLPDFQIIDVRTPVPKKLYSMSNQSALTQFSKNAIEHFSLDQHKPVVTICLSAHRSIPATRRLRQLGYDAQQLQVGMKAWWASDYPVVSNQ